MARDPEYPDAGVPMGGGRSRMKPRGRPGVVSVRPDESGQVPASGGLRARSRAAALDTIAGARNAYNEKVGGIPGGAAGRRVRRGLEQIPDRPGVGQAIRAAGGRRGRRPSDADLQSGIDNGTLSPRDVAASMDARRALPMGQPAELAAAAGAAPAPPAPPVLPAAPAGDDPTMARPALGADWAALQQAIRGAALDDAGRSALREGLTFGDDPGKGYTNYNAMRERLAGMGIDVSAIPDRSRFAGRGRWATDANGNTTWESLPDLPAGPDPGAPPVLPPPAPPVAPPVMPPVLPPVMPPATPGGIAGGATGIGGVKPMITGQGIGGVKPIPTQQTPGAPPFNPGGGGFESPPFNPNGNLDPKAAMADALQKAGMAGGGGFWNPQKRRAPQVAGGRY